MSAREYASLLERTIPFRFLPPDVTRDLLDEMRVRRLTAGEPIMRQGGEDREVYILASGLVEVYDESGPSEVHRNYIYPEHYFGEWESLFDLPRLFSIRAVEESVCLEIRCDRFLHLLETQAAFSQSLAVILREQQGIFAAFDRFKVELQRGFGQGYLTIAKMVPLYLALAPAIHPLIASDEIDTSALAYAIRRLPDNVTRTFAYFLTDEIPASYRDVDDLFRPIATAARRRDVYEMLPGSSMVLLRNGISDPVDLISCLCLYAVEARKIRRRFSSEQQMRLLTGAARGDGTAPKPGEFPLGDTEQAGLRRVWGDAWLGRVLDIVRHRETFAVTIKRHSERYSSRRTELWTKQLAAACRAVVGVDPADLDSDIPVHIISSNTHSVVNCLNDFYTSRSERMVQWAQDEKHPFAAVQWSDPYDYLYAIARDYFRANPEEAHVSTLSEDAQGIHRLSETASTGIQVQLVDVSQVCRSAIDPGITADRSGHSGLIVNIDYAFGQQAEHILRNLLLLFGPNVRSVNLLGKAGALVGARGDVLVPTAFLEQATDELYPVDGGDKLRVAGEVDSLRERLPGGSVHPGPMLTVDGTLLQNRDMLRFYRYIWSCVGMEMEGAYYYRQFREARSKGLIPADAVARFFYYVSDLPLEHESNLSARLEPHEGVPPLYATTRQVLAAILER